MPTTMRRPRTAPWAALLSLLACDSEDDSPNCHRAWGNLLTPAKGGAVLMDYAGPGPKLIAWERDSPPPGPMLLVDAERVTTASGAKQTCGIDQGQYHCGGDSSGSFHKI